MTRLGSLCLFVTVSVAPGFVACSDMAPTPPAELHSGTVTKGFQRSENMVGALKKATLAQAGQFLDKIPPGMERRYGFDSRDDFARVEAGHPYQMCTIPPDSLRQGLLTRGAVKHLNQYRVPLMVDGHARALLTMEQKDGAFYARDLGAAALARELDELRQSGIVRTDGDKPTRLLRLYQLNSDFVIPGDNETGEALMVLPLRSATGNLGISRTGGALTTLNDIGPALKRAMSTADLGQAPYTEEGQE